MKAPSLLAGRLLRSDRMSTLISIMISAFSVASMVVVFSICEKGIAAFITRTGQWGVSPASAAYDGLLTIVIVCVGVFISILNEESGPSPVAELFSEKSSVETQPTLLLLLAACSLIVSYFTLKILFAVHQKKRRHFYSSLLSAGASPSFARACSRAEGNYLCARGIPAGLALGYIGVLIVDLSGSIFFRAAASRPGGGMKPDGIGFSLIAGAAAAAFGYLFIIFCAGGAVKELTVKNTAAETRERLGANVGVSVFTLEARNPKLFGLPHHLALRCIENNIVKYGAIFIANGLYMSVCGISILDFFIVANYNGMQFGSEMGEAERFLLSSTLRYISAAAAMLFLSVFGTFFAMICNFESNTGCYVLMRALGASEDLILRTVRREGLYCVLIGGISSTACMVFLFCLLYTLYGRVAGLDPTGLLSALGGIFAMVTVFAGGVAAAVRVTCRRIEQTDLILKLKEFSYS